MVTETSRAVLWTLGGLLVLGLLALIIDAVLSLASWGLLVVDLAMLGLFIGAVVYVVLQAYRHLYNPRRVARLLEERAGIRDSRLINAVDFTDSEREPASFALVDRAIDEGESVAEHLSPSTAVRSGPLFKAMGVAAGAMLIVLVSFLAAPRLFARVLPRYLDPLGNHPPFTLIDFDVTITPEKIYHGHSATITVALSGPDLPNDADIVFVDREEQQRVPMFVAAEKTFVLPLERVVASRRFYVDTPKGRSDFYTLPVHAVPLIEHAAVGYRFPDYTSWPSSEHPLDSRGIRAIVGTSAIVSASSNIPLKHGLLELLPAEADAEGKAEQVTLAVDPEDSRKVSGSFEVSRNGRFRLSLVGENGAPSDETVEGRITATPDKAPRVAILSPEPQVIAVENWKVPVVIQATDDVAIVEVHMFAAVNGWGPSPLEVAVDQTQNTLARGFYEFDLATLGAKPGDVITYYASAYDNFPPDGQFTDTDTYIIQVISEDEYLEFARTKVRMDDITAEVEAFQARLDELRQQREEALQELKELQEKLAANGELSEEDQRRMAELQKQLEDFAEQTKQLADQMRERAAHPELYEFEQPYFEQLKSLAEQLDKQAAAASEVAEQLQNMPQSPGAQRRQGLQQAADEFERQQEPFDSPSQQQTDSMQEDLEKIKMADDMMAQAERIRSVIEQQRDLADRMAQFNNRDDLSRDEQRRLQRMAKQQDLLRQELEEAARDLREAAEKAKDELPKTAGDAMKICDAISQMQIPQDQDNAAQSARDGSPKDAHQSAEEAAQKLESLLSQCQGMQQQAGTELDGGLGLSRQQMQKALQQLSQGRNLPGFGNKQGSAGQGFSGTKARTTVMGPHIPTGNEADILSGRRTGKAGRGGPGHTDGDDFNFGAESLTPEARAAMQNAAGNLHGTPVDYRDQAEAYFKRIAEDEK